MGWVCTKEEVKNFLNKMRNILLNGNEMNTLSIPKEYKKGDKTCEFMISYNINRKMVYQELLKLDITNYSYTDYDNNPRFRGETVWIFGQMFQDVEVYIKLKLRSRVVCISFHEKEFDLHYPYL